MPSEEQPDPFYGEAARRAGGAGWLGFGLGRGHRRGPMDDAFAYQGDSSGLGRWTREHGWATPDEQPPVVAELLRGAPVPTGSGYVVTGVVAGRSEGWDAIAFDIGMQSAQGVVPKWAMTAVGRAEPGEEFWLHPRRLGRFHLRGCDTRAVDLASSALADRWTMSVQPGADGAAESISDRDVEQALLASDDGDELWATTTAIAAVRADGHRPALLEHHLRLLVTLVIADAAGRPTRRG